MRKRGGERERERERERQSQQETLTLFKVLSAQILTQILISGVNFVECGLIPLKSTLLEKGVNLFSCVLICHHTLLTCSWLAHYHLFSTLLELGLSSVFSSNSGLTNKRRDLLCVLLHVGDVIILPSYWSNQKPVFQLQRLYSWKIWRFGGLGD